MRTKTFLLVLFTLLVTSVFVRADYDVDVMGTDIGSVWGSGPYTADSVIGKAAVHSGLIAIGQRAIIRVQSLGNQSNYIGTTAHGITTNSYAPSWAAIAISYVGPGGVPPQVSLTIPSSVTVGATFTVTAHATDADGDLSQGAYSAAMKQSSSVSNVWLAERLGMGKPASASQFARRFLLSQNGKVRVDTLLSRVKT